MRSVRAPHAVGRWRARARILVASGLMALTLPMVAAPPALAATPVCYLLSNLGVDLLVAVDTSDFNPATNQTTRSHSSSLIPKRGHSALAIRAPRIEWSSSWPLPISCKNAATNKTRRCLMVPISSLESGTSSSIPPRSISVSMETVRRICSSIVKW